LFAVTVCRTGDTVFSVTNLADTVPTGSSRECAGYAVGRAAVAVLPCFTSSVAAPRTASTHVATFITVLAWAGGAARLAVVDLIAGLSAVAVEPVIAACIVGDIVTGIAGFITGVVGAVDTVVADD
jgi:hypothetical protein